MSDRQQYAEAQAEALARWFSTITQQIWTAASLPSLPPEERARIRMSAKAKIRAAKVKGTQIMGMDIGALAAKSGYSLIEFGSSDELLSSYFPPGCYLLMPADAARDILAYAYGERAELLRALSDPEVMAATEAVVQSAVEDAEASGIEMPTYDPGLPRLGAPNPEADIVRSDLPRAIEPEFIEG